MKLNVDFSNAGVDESLLDERLNVQLKRRRSRLWVPTPPILRGLLVTLAETLNRPDRQKVIVNFAPNSYGSVTDLWEDTIYIYPANIVSHHPNKFEALISEVIRVFAEQYIEINHPESKSKLEKETKIFHPGWTNMEKAQAINTYRKRLFRDLNFSSEVCEQAWTELLELFE